MAEKLLISVHELVYTIAYSLVGISVIVRLKLRDFLMVAKKRHGI